MTELKLQIMLVILGIIAALINIAKTLLEIAEKIFNMANAKGSPKPPADQSKTE